MVLCCTWCKTDVFVMLSAIVKAVIIHDDRVDVTILLPNIMLHVCSEDSDPFSLCLNFSALISN